MHIQGSTSKSSNVDFIEICNAATSFEAMHYLFQLSRRHKVVFHFPFLIFASKSPQNPWEIHLVFSAFAVFMFFFDNYQDKLVKEKVLLMEM